MSELQEWLPKGVVMVAVIYSIILHELAHAVTAYWCGDRTAKELGRITLNPIPNIDPIGSLLVPGLLIFFDAPFFFGWAKPVPIVPDNFKHRFWGDAIVSMAGIVVNLTIAFLALLLWAMTREHLNSDQIGVLSQIAYWNVLLALFNLLPIPPLDGHHLFKYVLPRALRGGYERLGFFGIGIVLVLWFNTPLSLYLMRAHQAVFGWMAKIGLTLARLFQ